MIKKILIIAGQTVCSIFFDFDKRVIGKMSIVNVVSIDFKEKSSYNVRDKKKEGTHDIHSNI